MSAHALNFKRLFLLSAAVVLLGGCATTVRIHDTVRWRGKDVSEFIAESAIFMPGVSRCTMSVRRMWASRAMCSITRITSTIRGNTPTVSL